MRIYYTNERVCATSFAHATDFYGGARWKRFRCRLINRAADPRVDVDQSPPPPLPPHNTTAKTGRRQHIKRAGTAVGGAHFRENNGETLLIKRTRQILAVVFPRNTNKTRVALTPLSPTSLLLYRAHGGNLIFFENCRHVAPRVIKLTPSRSRTRVGNYCRTERKKGWESRGKKKKKTDDKDVLETIPRRLPAFCHETTQKR